MKDTIMGKTFTKIDLTGMEFRAEAYFENGVWYWTSNGRSCPLDACERYSIPCDVRAQRDAVEEDLVAFIAEYKKRRPSAEEKMEARAAFGTGVEVMNVITGDTYVT